MKELERVYKDHLERVRSYMVTKKIDYFFLPLGTEFYYLTGAPAPLHHDMNRVWGDWIDGIFLGIEDGPILIYHSTYNDPLPIKPLIDIHEIFIMPDDDDDPDATMRRAIGSFHTDGKIIATIKRTWGKTLLALQGAAPGASFVSLSEPEWDEIQAVKDEYELGIMREAANMTVDIMQEIARFIKVGMKIMDVKVEMLHQMMVRDVSPSFPPGIGCVNKDSDPDVRWNPQEIIKPLGVIAFDFGVTYKGYQTDFGRSLFVKDALPDRIKAWSVLTSIIQELTGMMGDGKITPAQIQAHGVKRAKENNFYEGYYGYYRWSIGHAIGTNVHEWPWLRSGHGSAHQPIKAGMVFCLEPKIFHWGQFYERIEDMILVGNDHGELLTAYPYEPVFVG